MAGNAASGDQKKQIKPVTSVGPTTSFREEALKNALDQTAFKRGKKPGFGLPVNWSHTLHHASWIGLFFNPSMLCFKHNRGLSAWRPPPPRKVRHGDVGLLALQRGGRRLEKRGCFQNSAVPHALFISVSQS